MYILPKNISLLKQKILDFSSDHCFFHYHGSYNTYNLACALAKSGRFTDAINEFTKSIEFYKENSDSYYVRGLVNYFIGNLDLANDDYKLAFKYRNTHNENYISSYQNYELYSNINFAQFDFTYHQDFKNPVFSLNSIDLKILYDHAKIAIDAKNYLDVSDIYKSIMVIANKLHFDYHVDVANLNFELANEYEKHGHIHEAIFFAQRALETDSRNLKNHEYERFINRNKIAISMNY